MRMMFVCAGVWVTARAMAACLLCWEGVDAGIGDSGDVFGAHEDGSCHDVHRSVVRSIRGQNSGVGSVYSFLCLCLCRMSSLMELRVQLLRGVGGTRGF